MEKIKKFRRWPNDNNALQKRLRIITKKIDEILKKDFSYEILDEKTGQDIYQEKFRELFLQTDYKYDNEPVIIFYRGRICCSPTIGWSVSIKNKNGENILC